MNTTKKLLDYFKKKEWFKKPKDVKWKTIGNAIGVSEEAARSAWKRYRLENKSFSKPKKDFPKILVFDIESAPLRGYVWRLWKQNISPSQLLNKGNYFILSWAAKWLFEDTVLSDRLTAKEVLEEEDTRIVKSLHQLLDEADIVIAHWGSQFDVKMMNGRFAMKNLPPPSSFQLIDTKVHASKAFNFPSYKLDYLAQQFGVGQKIKTDFDLWDRCMKGEEAALEYMDIYCREDVLILEGVYLAMRAYIKPHPNVGLYVESNVEVCPTCGSQDLRLVSTYYTTMNKYDEMQCQDCGASCRSRKAITSKGIKQRLTSSIPK